MNEKTTYLNCPCKKKSCPRHGDCEACRRHHADSKYKRPVYCEKKISLRKFRKGDESAVSDVIRTTLSVSNSKDYSPEFIEENIKSHSPEVIASRAAESHFYVVLDGRKIIGCGGITGYWGSATESYLVSVFVLPEYQGRGIGRKIIETLEADEYFLRAWRTEVGSSRTAVDFYLRMGYKFKNNITVPDEFGVVRLEKADEKSKPNI
ncbi:MAG: GNAT family N-acetyltransferase [Oscillospiraceae bacterium]|nr:GNAT family N-acetyltransferase [Oscillospiraceae bacterium]